MPLTQSDKQRLRRYWRQNYYGVQVRSTGEIWAQRFKGEAWGLLETASMAEASAKVLKDREAALKLKGLSDA